MQTMTATKDDLMRWLKDNANSQGFVCEGRTITQKELAELFGRSIRTIAYWFDELRPGLTITNVGDGCVIKIKTADGSTAKVCKTELQTINSLWLSLWEKCRGCKCLGLTSDELTKLAIIETAIGLDGLKAAITAFLTTSDDYITAAGFSTALFIKQVNRYIGLASAVTATSKRAARSNDLIKAEDERRYRDRVAWYVWILTGKQVTDADVDAHYHDGLSRMEALILLHARLKEELNREPTQDELADAKYDYVALKEWAFVKEMAAI